MVVRYGRGDALDRYDSDAPFRPPVLKEVKRYLKKPTRYIFTGGNEDS